MSSVIVSAGVERWQKKFVADPLAALDGLLTGRMNLGQFERARPADALAQMLSQEQIPAADSAMQSWLVERMGTPLPEGLSPKRYADALVEAFRAVQGVPLSGCRVWCAARPAELRAWLRSFYLGASRDPEGALLVALAHYQSDRSLLFLWHDVIRRGRPEQHVAHALVGLRLMPVDDQGAVEHSLPRALLRGLVDYGETLIRLGDKKGKPWLEELDFLAAVYPMSKDAWSRRFREVVEIREISRDLSNLLDQRYPVTRQSHKFTSAKGVLSPPGQDERNKLLLRIASDFQGAKAALSAYFDHHRLYAQESGDSFYLVRSFCNVGDRLLEFDQTWARELAHEAVRWEPNNHHAWTLLARALEKEGDWRRAEAVYWAARRRFPQDSFTHSQLGHALIVHNQADLGEMVYRQAIQLFPSSDVCWHDLGHALRITGQPEKALEVYNEAQMKFQNDHIAASVITDILIEQGRLTEAEKALQKAEQVTANNDMSQRKLAQVRQRLQRAIDGAVLKPRTLQTPFEALGGDLSALVDITGIDIGQAPALGRASLWRRSCNGGLERARTELDNLRDGSAKLIEQGLLLSAEHGWQAAAEWFDGCWERYAGDGVLRLHRLRALARAGKGEQNWALEKKLYPELLPAIITEEKGRPPRIDVNQELSDLSEEQHQDLWYVGLASGTDEYLRDFAEEDYLAARQYA